MIMGKLNNSLLFISTVIFLLSVSQTRNVHGGVYRVTHRFGDEAVEDPENHNQNHQGRLLAADDFPFHSDKGVLNNSLYCEEIPVGSYLDLHMDATDAHWVKHCCKSDHPCTSKYLITFILHYINDQISENRTTIAATSKGIFLYDHRQTAVNPYIDDPLVVTDLVVSGKVTKKKFSHCLDGRNGMGIIVVGDVVQPNLKTTPLFSNQNFISSHYYVNTKAIEVGNVVLNFSNEVLPVRDGKRTRIDSGTSMAYFPVEIFNELYKMVMSSQLSSGLETRIDQENNYTCFSINKSIDDSFPSITFTLENSTELKAYPHEYLFQLEKDWCVGFHDNEFLPPDEKDMIVLGDLILSNRVLLYDLENNSLGLAEQNCSSAIVVTDEQTGDAYLVNAKHHIMSSTSSSLNPEWVVVLFSLAAFLCLLDALCTTQCMQT